MARRKDLFYGHSLKGKSRAVVELIVEAYNETGKKSRLYIGDGGLATYINTGLVEAGLLDVCEFSHLAYPSTVLKAMSMLYMPNKEGVWEKPTPEFLSGKTHAYVIYEGATVMKQWLMGNNEGAIADKISKGEKFGGVRDDGGSLITQDGKVNGVPDEWRKHGQVTGLHYMKAYRELESAIQRSSGRSGQHGQIQGKKVIGPDICGKSRAATISALFGNTLHFDTAMKRGQREQDALTGKNVGMLEPEYRVYTRDHYDPDGLEMVEFRAGCRYDGMKLFYNHEESGKAILDFYADLGEKAQHKAKRFTKGGEGLTEKS